MAESAVPEGAPASTSLSPVTLDRRTLVKASAWAAPVLALAVASPAITASEAGDVPVGKLRIENFRVENRDSDGKKRGPLAIFVPIFYDVGINHLTDPATATVPWIVTISGPTGTETKSGVSTIAKYGTAQPMFWYRSDTDTNLPSGTYTLTLTIFGSDGSTSKSATITIP